MNFELVTKTATEPDWRKWSNKEVALFHAFNPHGLVARKQAVDEQIAEAHKKGLCKSGAMLAYGTFNSFSRDLVMGLVERQRVRRINLLVAIEMLQDDIKKAEEFLRERGAI